MTSPTRSERTMTPITPTPIHYRPDGSIDTARHMQAGRKLRSRKAHDLLGLTTAKSPAPRRMAWASRLGGLLMRLRPPARG